MAKKIVKKQAMSELSNDELLEQIMAKKKAKKKNVNTKNTKVNDVNIYDKKIRPRKKENLSELSNDEIYEQIVRKKEAKKKKQEIKNKENIKDKSKVNEISKTEEEKKDLIITREIHFDEDIDIKSKKSLKKLREAIEEFDKLEELEDKNKESLDDVMSSSKEDSSVPDKVIIEYPDSKELEKTKDRKIEYESFNRKYKYLIVLCIILFIVLFLILFFYLNNNTSDSQNEPTIVDDYDSEKVEQELLEQYNNCLLEPYDINSISDDLLRQQEELSTYLEENYKASIKYEDLSTGYTYSYNGDQVYYAASTMKILSALYIYSKAATGELDLDEVMTYSSKYKYTPSIAMGKFKFGTKVTLRDLVKYSVTVSDNSAYQMLVSYIGRNKLKEFGNSLGAKNTLTGSDNFSNIDVNDAIIYVKALNDFINNNSLLGEELQSYFLSAEQNDLEFADLGIKAAHKYGEYGSYYHDIGIVYDDSPYVVAILTLEGKGDFEEKVKDINSHIYELHQKFKQEREEGCRIQVYGS